MPEIEIHEGDIQVTRDADEAMIWISRKIATTTRAKLDAIMVLVR